MTTKELREKRAPLGEEIKRIADTPETEWNSETEETWQRVNDEYNDLSKQIDRQERADEIEAESRKVITPDDVTFSDTLPDAPSERTQAKPEDRDLAFQGWARNRAGMDVLPEHREAAQRVGMNLNASEMEMPILTNQQLREARTTTYYASTDSNYGGQTVPSGFVNSFEGALTAFGGVRNVATIMRTDSGNALTWPTYNDTSNSGELLAEAADSTDSSISEAAISTSSITLNAYKISSKIVRVSRELLEDSAFDMGSEIGRMCGERIARGAAAYYATGTGSAQPNGIVTASYLGKTAASATALDSDEIYDLVHSVDPAYRVNAGFLCHDNVVLALRKLKDSDGRYLWEPNVQVGAPDRFAGFPVNVCQNMASSIAASAKVLLFGELSKFIIRDVRGVRFVTLVERYAEYDHVAFIAILRTDSEELDAGTYPIKHMVMAAS